MAFVCVSNNFMTVARQTAMTKNPDDLMRLEQSVKHAIEPFKSWTLSRGGTVVSDDPCVSIYEVSVHHIGDIQALVNRFKEHTKLECWSGIGNSMVDAVKAADFAKKKGLDKPFLMEEEINDEQSPSLNVLKSEGEEDLNKSLKNALRGAGIAALMSMSGHQAKAPDIKPQEAAIVKPQETKPAPAPVKLDKPRAVPSHLKGTFVENYDPSTLRHGMNDVMHLIGMTESNNGRDMDHRGGLRGVQHPLTDANFGTFSNTAFGHLGFRPWVAFETYVKQYGGGSKFKGRNLLLNKAAEKAYGVEFKKLSTQKQKALVDGVTKDFMTRFKSDPALYNKLAMEKMKETMNLFGKRDKTGQHIINPMDVIAGWHYGTGTKPAIVQADPHKYKRLVQSRLQAAFDKESEHKWDFSDLFGKMGHNEMMKLVNQK